MRNMKNMKNTVAEANMQKKMEQLYLMRCMERVEQLDSESEEYLRVKGELESYMTFHPEATVNDFMERFSSLHRNEEINLFLPIAVMSRMNRDRMAREAMTREAGDLETAMRAFLKIRKNASPKAFFEEYQTIAPTVTKEAVIATMEKIHDESGVGRVLTELWIENPLSREEAEEAAQEAIAEFRRRTPEAAEFLEHFRYEISDLTIEETFDLTGESYESEEWETVELLHRKHYDGKEDLIENEVENLNELFEAWLDEQK